MKKSTPLSKGIKNYSLFSSAMLASALAADAQVIYTDVDPDIVLSGDIWFAMDFNNDGITDYTFESYSDIGNTPYHESFSIRIWDPVNSVANSYNNLLPKACNYGTPIDSNLLWDAGGGMLGTFHSGHFPSSGGSWMFSTGNFLGQSDRYLAMRFNIDGEQHYGWIRLSLSTTANKLTIHDYAYGVIPETAIIAGCGNGTTLYADVDHDGYGDSANSIFEADCIPLNGFVTDSTDCNDTNSGVHPGVCDDVNGIDDNCDGEIDFGGGAIFYYADEDSDGYGMGIGTVLCSDPGFGFANNNDDCNDTDAFINPGVQEEINCIDDDCDGFTDDNFWTLKDNFGGKARLNAVGFSIGSKGYIGTGFSGSAVNFQDFWEYDPVDNSWTQKADFTGGERYNAVGFSIGNKGYVGTGNYANIYKNDFWEYDPVANTWIQKADFDGTARGSAVGFSISGKGYIGTGVNDAGYKKDFWEYDPSSNTWTSKTDFGGPACLGAVGFSLGNKGYIGTQTDFWEYDPVVNSWTQKADYGGNAFEGVGFSIGSKGYLGTGHNGGISTNDFWEYDPVLNTWTQKADFGGGARSGAVGFGIGDKGYVGTGYGTGEYKKDFWEFTLAFTGWMIYADADDDGFGNMDTGYFSTDCLMPAGYVIYGTDCNDNDASVNPAKLEICNNIDDNCNGTPDDGLTFTTYYSDSDGDNYGDISDSGNSWCADPGLGYSSDHTDCDDVNASINPATIEICDGIDNNCDGNIDPLSTFYADEDIDGYGNSSITFLDCISPAGYVANSTDCDDSNALVNPSATEICDNIDNNCNGNIDEGLFHTFYADADGDNYGNAGVDTLSCANPPGYVHNHKDCNDSDSTIHAGVPEVCNGLDDDCNLIADDGLIFIPYYVDVDGDSYGDLFGSQNSLCNNPGAGYSPNNSDCDDTNAFISPLATEICNDLDDNCNGAIDDGLILTMFYDDADGDSYGDLLDAGNSLCYNPGTGYTTNKTDCDDANAAINPAVLEICDNIDNNCDGSIDEGFPLTTFYADTDGDNYGDNSISKIACILPDGFVTDSSDCDDTNSLVYPADILLQWQKSLGGSGDEVAYAIQQISDGGFIVTGYSNSNNGDVAGNHGSNDYWIVKLDSNGNLNWQKSLGGSATDEASSIQQTSDGGFIVAGSSYSNSGDVSGNHGLSDYWIVKLDANGNLIWQKSLGGSDFDGANAIQQTFDGGFVVAGVSWSNNGDVSGNHGDQDYWIIRLDANGNLIWQKSLGGSVYDRANAIQQTADGGFIVAGNSESNNGDVSGNHGSIDCWIVKLDANGNLVWQKSLGGSNGDNAYSIKQATDGGFVVAGISYSNNGDVSGNHGYGDYWIVKLDANGNLDWQKSLGGSDEDEAYSIHLTSNGFIAAGISASNNGDVSGNHGNYDYWIVKLDGNGILDWQKTLGGSSGDLAHSIHRTSEGGFVAAGVSYSNDGDVSGNHGGEDFWIVKLLPDPNEICNNLDDNCNGAIDEDIYITYYADADNDGFGNPNNSIDTCAQPTGFAIDKTDCDDTNASINPNATEITSNGIDDDCDGLIDEFETGTTSIVNEEAVFSLFPNPTNGEFVVHLQLQNELNSEAKIEVINLLGQVVYNKTSALLKGKLEEAIKLNDEADGIYLVRVMVNDQLYCGRIVFEK